ncbi:MAG: rhomboid family intramembrane serine protease [Acidobacteriota bacterium]
MVYYRYQQPTIRFGPELTPVVKKLIIVNVAVFVVDFLLTRSVFELNSGISWFAQYFGLSPYDVTHSLHFWQVGTYLFLHDINGFMHILFNMFALWMFGSDLEKSWGSEKFLFYYFLTGIGAGICVVLVDPSSPIPTVGASGAIFGILLAFGLLFPDRPILVALLIPVKAKYFVMIIGGITFLSLMGSPGSGISHIAHAGGMIFGYLYLRRGTLFRTRLRYHEWREARRRKKFKVYMEKISRDDPDRWVN